MAVIGFNHEHQSKWISGIIIWSNLSACMLTYSSLVICNSYVISARLMESGPLLALQMPVIQFIACQLTSFWTTVRGTRDTTL